MDHHPHRTRAVRHADADSDGPDYTTAYLAGRAAGAAGSDMDAYLEAADQAHNGNSHADRSDESAKTGETALPA